MIFKFATKELFSDKGVFIKKLHCPYHIKWQELNDIKHATHKACSICNKTIYNSINMSDQQIVDLVTLDPKACLKVSLNQNNVKTVDIYERA
jgi:hypothetical protein